MTYLAKREFTTVFGKHTIEANKTEVTLDGAGDNYITDFLLRNGGKDSLQAKILHSDRNVNAINDPSAYILSKATDLGKIVTALKTLHTESFERYSKRNLTIKEIRQKVKKDLDEKFEMLIRDHKEDFPQDVVSKAITKAIGN